MSEEKQELHHVKLDYKPIHMDGLNQLLRDELSENYTGISINAPIEEFILHFKEEPNKQELEHALGLIQDHDAEASKLVGDADELQTLKAEAIKMLARIAELEKR